MRLHGLLLPWVLTALVGGCVILFAVVVFLCCKRRRKAARSTLGSPRVQTDPASDSKRFVNKVSLEPSTTYSNWPNIPLTHRTQDRVTNSDAIYENCCEPVDMT
ncbi:hypothetical protein SKAU_G00418890 [Synaphobranchus kaupii]|uniref:Uncharacterized protein n=1 Tax=Synaphobranchus kaupii TaxID=118154 RepID=A0A9Q1E681_SYNKA|nr:hypothetical protein SKAU_G00418890 [Synaphobranchus kaupii]